MNKKRITARVNGGYYEVIGLDGSVVFQKTLDDARNDSGLAAAIARNKWPDIPETQ